MEFTSFVQKIMRMMPIIRKTSVSASSDVYIKFDNSDKSLLNIDETKNIYATDNSIKIGDISYWFKILPYTIDSISSGTTVFSCEATKIELRSFREDENFVIGDNSKIISYTGVFDLIPAKLIDVKNNKNVFIKINNDNAMLDTSSTRRIASEQRTTITNTNTSLNSIKYRLLKEFEYTGMHQLSEVSLENVCYIKK